MKPRFKGSFGLVMNLISDAFFGNKKTTFNYTMDSSTLSAGNEDLSGCLLSLSKNQSDIFMLHVSLPLPKVNNIDVMGVVLETRMEFITGYSTENNVKGHSTDLWEVCQQDNLIPILMGVMMPVLLIENLIPMSKVGNIWHLSDTLYPLLMKAVVHARDHITLQEKMKVLK